MGCADLPPTMPIVDGAEFKQNTAMIIQILSSRLSLGSLEGKQE